MNQILVRIECYQGSKVQLVVGSSFDTPDCLDIVQLRHPYNIILNSTFRCATPSTKNQLRRFS